MDGPAQQAELADLDTRTATIAPSQAQLDAVAALGASARWDYPYPWTNVWFETECSPSNFVPGSGNDINAAVD